MNVSECAEEPQAHAPLNFFGRVYNVYANKQASEDQIHKKEIRKINFDWKINNSSPCSRNEGDNR